MKKRLIALVILIQFLVPTGLYAQDNDIYGLWVSFEHEEGEKTIVDGKDITNDIEAVANYRCSLAEEEFGENGKFYYINEDTVIYADKAELNLLSNELKISMINAEDKVQITGKY